MAIWKEEVFGTRRCVNCGYLGKRDNISSVSICYEATAIDRQTGMLTKTMGMPTGAPAIGGRHDIPTRPWCYVGKAHFQEELEAMGAKEHEADKVREVIEKDRNCISWYPWREFSTPKEHFEESMMLAMEERREKFDLKLFELSQKIQNDSKEIVKKSDRFNRRITIFIIILAVLEVVGTLLALLLP